MPTVVSTPVMVSQAALFAATGMAQSINSNTVAIDARGAWEVIVQGQIQYSDVSNDAVIHVYQSLDGGANYDLQSMMSIAIPMQTVAPRIGRVSARIPQGQYILQIVNSGPNSATITLPTYVVISAVQNV